MPTKTPLIVSPELTLVCNILLVTSRSEDLYRPKRLFRLLLRDIRKQEIDFGPSQDALWDWFQLQCIAAIHTMRRISAS